MLHRPICGLSFSTILQHREGDIYYHIYFTKADMKPAEVCSIRIRWWIAKAPLYLFTFILCVNVLPGCLEVHHVYTVPKEAREMYQIPWNRNYRWLRAAMRVLKTKLRSFTSNKCSQLLSDLFSP